MKIENSKQLDLFLKSLYKEVEDQRILDGIEPIVNVDRLQTFSKKMLLLQWYFYQGNEEFQSDQKMYDNALNRNLENGLIQRFSIDTNLGLLKDEWAKESARTEMGKMAKQGILIRKDMKNYVITKLGEKCSNFLYFKILESVFGLINIWKLIKSDLTKVNLRNIDPNITLNDLENWFIVEKQDTRYIFTQKFRILVDFLRAHPELYPNEYNIILDNLYFWIKNSIILNLDQKNVRLTISDKKINHYKDNLKEIDWIFKVRCNYKNSEIRLLEWAISEENTHPRLDNFLNKCLIVTAPPGYGKSILSYQLSLDLLSDFNIRKNLPIYLNAKHFNRQSGILSYNNYDIFNYDLFEGDINEKNSELVEQSLLGATLSEYDPNQLMVKIFLSILHKHNFIYILDGWDELEPDIQQFFTKYFNYIISRKGIKNKPKILITSRFLDSFLNSLMPKKKKSTRESERIVTLKLPKLEDIEKYLRLTTPKFKDKQTVKDLAKNFNGILTPLDLFLIGIFPMMNIPKYKSLFFKRWIYYQVLSDVLKPKEFKKLKSEEDIRIRLETVRLKRELDDQSFYFTQLIDGTLIGNDGKNYALLKILPQIAYSYFRPNMVQHIDYLDAINSNPLLKRFLRPFYKGFHSYAQIADPHFYAYLIAKYTFSRFIQNQPIEPIPYPDIEQFIMEFYLQNSNNPKIIQLGILKPEHFVCYMYLQSDIILPTLQLPYNYGEIFSYALYSDSIKYGVYLLKTFQFQFKKAIHEKNEKSKQRVLETFNKFRKERPTRTIGSYQDEFSHEFEVGEPQINHEPMEYFNLIAELYGFNPNLQKSGQEIEYLNIQDQYLDAQFGFSYIHSYWKREELSKLMLKIIESPNVFIIPWVARVLPKFLKRQLSIPLNFDLIIERYKTQNDEYIKSNLLKILISSNPEIVLSQSQLFLKDDNLDNLNQLVDLLCRFIKKQKKISKNLFGFWINFFKTPIISIKQQYKLVRTVFDIEFDSEQIKSLHKVYNSEKSRVAKRSKEETQELHIQIEENPKEMNYIFNCLILLNYKAKNREKIEDQSAFHREYDLLLQYALEKRRFYYITLIRDSGIISDKKLTHKLFNLGFEYVFSYSSELFQSLNYEVPYFKRIGEFLKETHEFLLEVQRKWLEKNPPSKISEHLRLLEKIFDFYEEHEDTWLHYTDLGGHMYVTETMKLILR